MASKPPAVETTTDAAGSRRRAADVRVPVVPVLIGAVAVLVIVAIAAVALTGKKSSSANKAAEGVAQTRPVTVTGTPLPQFQNTTNDAAVGQVAPTLTGTNFAGQPVTIGKDGHPKAVVFVAHWCPHCQAEVPRIEAYLKSAGLPKNVELYFVPTNTNPNDPNYPPSAWLQRAGVGSVPTLVDSSTGDAYSAFGGTAFPYFVLLDQNNKVLARLAGEQPQGVYPTIFAALAKNESPVASSSSATSPASSSPSS
jgi:cytochrome c biogenesis protein CcmG, thiol:disulfide interchange protein DsbE